MMTILMLCFCYFLPYVYFRKREVIIGVIEYSSSRRNYNVLYSGIDLRLTMIMEENSPELRRILFYEKLRECTIPIIWAPAMATEKFLGNLFLGIWKGGGITH
jgi:hypothetical protein